jgi:hypothetical protein
MVSCPGRSSHLAAGFRDQQAKEWPASLILMGRAHVRLFARGSTARTPGVWRVRGGWTLCGGSVSGHLVPERVLGQGFFDTAAERGPRRATEKNVALSGEAPLSGKVPQAIFRAKRVEVAVMALSVGLRRRCSR